MKSQANFHPVTSFLSRLNLRGLLIASVGVGALLLAGCNDESDQITVVTDTFQKRLDAQDKELASLRASEREAKDQVANLQGQMTALRSELDANRSKVDATALARELAPLLTNQPNVVTRVEGAGTGLPPTGSRSAETVVATTQPNPTAGPRTNGVKSSGGEGRKKIEMDWGPAAPR